MQAWSVEDERNLKLALATPPISHPTRRFGSIFPGTGDTLRWRSGTEPCCLWRRPEGPPVAYRIEAGGPTWSALSPDRRLVLPKGTSFRERYAAGDPSRTTRRPVKRWARSSRRVASSSMRRSALTAPRWPSPP